MMPVFIHRLRAAEPAGACAMRRETSKVQRDRAEQKQKERRFHTP